MQCIGNSNGHHRWRQYNNILTGYCGAASFGHSFEDGYIITRCVVINCKRTRSGIRRRASSRTEIPIELLPVFGIASIISNAFTGADGGIACCDDRCRAQKRRGASPVNRKTAGGRKIINEECIALTRHQIDLLGIRVLWRITTRAYRAVGARSIESCGTVGVYTRRIITTNRSTGSTDIRIGEGIEDIINIVGDIGRNNIKQQGAAGLTGEIIPTGICFYGPHRTGSDFRFMGIGASTAQSRYADGIFITEISRTVTVGSWIYRRRVIIQTKFEGPFIRYG